MQNKWHEHSYGRCYVKRNVWPQRVNLLKTKRNLLYIRNQSVPRCKYFPLRL